MFFGSRDITRTGHHDASSSMVYWRRIAGEILEFAEWLCGQLDKNAGEELVFVATKDVSTVNCWQNPTQNQMPC
jgi:hypothetical protein